MFFTSTQHQLSRGTVQAVTQFSTINKCQECFTICLCCPRFRVTLPLRQAPYMLSCPGLQRGNKPLRGEQEKSKKTMKQLTKPSAGVCEVRWSLWRDILAEAATTWFSCSCWCEAGKGYSEVRWQKRGFCSYLNVSATWTANDVQNSSFVKDWKVTLDSYQAGYIFVVVKKKKRTWKASQLAECYYN